MFSEEIDQLNSGSHLYVDPITDTLKTHDRWDSFFRPFELQKEIQKVAQFFNAHPSKDPKEAKETTALADAFILRYASNPLTKKILQVFDRNMALLRPTIQYLHPENQRSFNNWQKSRQSTDIFHHFPKFSEFLETSKILDQIKVSKDLLSLKDGKPGLLVEGVWHTEDELLKRFSIEKSNIYNSPFLMDRETREVYTYLDNGKGLQKHHPYLSMSPISTLSQEEYLKTLEKAHEFIRPEEAHLTQEERAEKNKERTFILQYVTAWRQCGTSNFHELLVNPKHVYLRLVIGQNNPDLQTQVGEVYEAGYFRKTTLLPGSATQGHFLNPDAYEYIEGFDKIVTNIPITQEEANRFYAFTKKYHFDSIYLGNEVGYHLTHQNCSVYAEQACLAANIKIPTQISLKQTIYRICPDIIKKIGIQLKEWKSQTIAWWKENKPRIIPQTFDSCISKIHSLFHRVGDFFAACFSLPLRTALGEAFGDGGSAFRQLNKPQEQLTPPLKNWKNIFSLSHYILNLPGIAQEWQLKQPSTVIYRNQTQLTIVP